MLKVKEDVSTSFLIVSEPRATFTSGVSALPSDLLWNEQILKEKGIALCPVTRGGKWTYHGPGQVVIFPIFRLEQFGLNNRDTKGFVELLTQAVQSFLETEGLTSSVKETPYGIYVNDKKICSFGVRVERGITSHGLALSLYKQSEPFKGINPCGHENAKLTSLWEEERTITWVDAAHQLVESIKKSFKLP